MQGFVARMVEGVKQNTFSRLLVNIVQVMVIAFNNIREQSEALYKQNHYLLQLCCFKVDTI